MAHRLARGPPPSSSWERTPGTDCAQETGVLGKTDPAQRDWSQGVEGKPSRSSPRGQRGLREPLQDSPPWDIPSEDSWVPGQSRP